MNPALLLDIHILVRWLTAPRKLSRDQSRVLREAMRYGRPAAVSAISLLEIAILFGTDTSRMEFRPGEFWIQSDRARQLKSSR